MPLYQLHVNVVHGLREEGHVEKKACFEENER